MCLIMSDPFSRFHYNPLEAAIRRMNEMNQDRLRAFSELSRPHLLDIAGLTNSAVMRNFYPLSALEDAIRNMNPASQIEQTILNLSHGANLEALARRMDFSSAYAEMASTASIVNQITDHQNQMSRQILGSINEAIGSTRIGLESLMPQIETFQNWALINSSVFDKFAYFWEEFEANYNIAEAKAVRILKKYNWFVSPSLPYDFVYEAVKLGRKRGNKLAAMNSLFWDYFSDNNFKNLSSMVRGWSGNPLFKGRMKILRDCVASFRHAKPNANPSNLVVPTLIAHIDGVLTKFRKQKGLKKDRLAINEIQVWFEAEAISQDILSEQMLEVANYILFSILFQTASYGKPLANPFTLSRHKIMHGEYLTYGRKANSIRAFLILDFLAALETI